MMVPLGFFAGNANENTIGWIGLSGIFYLFHAWKNKTLRLWMISGFVGLSIGFSLLMLAPGNFVRLSNDLGIKETINSHFIIMWLSLVFQNFLWFYLWKGYRWNRHLHPQGVKKRYFHLAFWFAIVSVLFNLIMLLSPIMPARSTFPNLVFLVTAVMLVSRWAELENIYVIQRLLEKCCAIFCMVYFIWTAGFSLWWYHENYLWEKGIIDQAENMPREEILVVESSPIYEDSRYLAMSGFHLGNSALTANENDWKNVSFARYYHIKGIRLADTADK